MAPTSVETPSLRPGFVARARACLPRGGVLRDEDFAKRHRLVLGVLAGHVVAILLFGLSRGAALSSLLAADALVALFLAVAWQPHLLGARARAAVSAVGLLICSAILVHLAGGSIEMHFHFFVMVGLIALYQDWLPFLLAIAFVGVHHGLVGVLTPHDVYRAPGSLVLTVALGRDPRRVRPGGERGPGRVVADGRGRARPLADLAARS